MNSTPFIYGKTASNENFTNREKDFVYLSNNFKWLINSILISPRRWGETSLVNKVADSFSPTSDYIVCKMHIGNCKTRFVIAYLVVNDTCCCIYLTITKCHFINSETSFFYKNKTRRLGTFYIKALY